MTMKRFYVGVENLALTAPQRDTLVDALKQLGANSDPSPARRNHWRVRLDNDAVLFEAEFDDANFTITALRTRLAAIFAVPLAQVTNTTTTPAVGTVLTMTYQSVARMRFVLFGGASATYDQSQAAAREYLAANAAAWEPSP